MMAMLGLRITHVGIEWEEEREKRTTSCLCFRLKMKDAKKGNARDGMGMLATDEDLWVGW
jgi:hypothetical protein